MWYPEFAFNYPVEGGVNRWNKMVPPSITTEAGDYTHGQVAGRGGRGSSSFPNKCLKISFKKDMLIHLFSSSSFNFT